MNTGQKEWAEEIEQASHEGHIARLEAIGFERIAILTDKLSRLMTQLERETPTQSRDGWSIIDGIKKVCFELR